MPDGVFFIGVADVAARVGLARDVLGLFVLYFFTHAGVTFFFSLQLVVRIYQTTRKKVPIFAFDKEIVV